MKKRCLLKWQRIDFKSLKSGSKTRYEFIYEYEFENKPSI